MKSSQRKAMWAKGKMLRVKLIKGESFPYGMIKSKNSKLIKGNDFYFVSDYWTSTRYPKTKSGLYSAKKHVAGNKVLDDAIRKENILRGKQ